MTHARRTAPRPARRSSHHASRRQARRTLRYRLQSRLKRAPRKLVSARPGGRALSLWLVVVCGWALYLFGTSDWFYVDTVLVEGNSTIPADEIVKASGAMYDNVFYLDFGQIEKQVRALSAVQVAHASYVWPNIVRIAVEEQKPVFVWESNRQTAWVDETGQLLAARTALTNTLIVRDADNRQRTQVDPRLIGSVRAMAAALPQVKRLDYSDVKGLSFTDEHGWRILFGQPEQINAKLAILEALSAYLVAQKINVDYVDVRLPERAFYKPK